MDNPDALYRTLADAPDDWQARSVLADWYEEAGRQDVADCLRWMIAHRRRPNPSRFGPKCSWFVDGVNTSGWDPESDLPGPLYARLRGEESVPGGFREYDTLREADEDFYQAWALARARGELP